MPTSLHDFKERFQELVLNFLWRQWSALGVAGEARTGDDWVIDPEALLLVTTTFGRYDPRLFDEVLDWLSKEGTAINLQRLKNLQILHRLGHPGVLAAMAAAVGRKAHQAKWRLYAQELANTGVSRARSAFRKRGRVYEIPESPVSLFPGVPVTSAPDEDFLKLGWLRNPVQLRGLSASPNPHLPTNLLLALRALFGMQARAEIMTCLLCSRAEHPAHIAELTGYFPRTVQLALNEMARSGHLRTNREGREKCFSVWHPHWSFLVKPAPHFPQWIHWSPIFKALEAIHEELDTPSLADAPASVQAIELREIPEILEPALRRSGVWWEFENMEGLTGEAFVQALLANLTQFLG